MHQKKVEAIKRCTELAADCLL